MTKEEFYSRALSFDEVGEQVDIFKKEKIKYEQEIERLNNIIEEARKYIEQEEISIIYQELGLQQINVKNELLDILKGSDKE